MPVQSCVDTIGVRVPSTLLITSAQGASAKQVDLLQRAEIRRGALHAYSRLAMLPLHTNG